MADTDNGKSSTEVNLFNPAGQPQSVSFNSAGNAAVQYNYYPATNAGLTGSPLALSTLGITGLPTVGSVQTTYAYGPADKRLASITVNGVKMTYTYLPNSADQLNAVSVTVPGNSNAMGMNTLYLPDSSDPARLSRLSVSTGAVGQAFVETLTRRVKKLSRAGNGADRGRTLWGQVARRGCANSLTSE